MLKTAKKGQKNLPNPTKKGAEGLKRRRNLWSLGRKGNAGRVGSENPRQDEPSVEGLNSKVDTVDRQVGFRSPYPDTTMLRLP